MSATDDDHIYTVDEVVEYKDIISDLSPFPHIIVHILEYIPVRQLCRMACVCKSWRNMVCDSYEANRRRLRYLKKVRRLRKSVGQENWPIKRRTPVAANTRRDALSDIRNVFGTRKGMTRSSAHLNSSLTVSTRHTDLGIRALR